MTSHTGEWSLNPSTHSLEWAISVISSEESSGSLEFNVGGDDPGVFFPVDIKFVSENLMSGISVASVHELDEDEDEIEFSKQTSLQTGNYAVV